MKRQPEPKEAPASEFEKLVKAVVSLPKDEVERLKKADKSRQRRKWRRREPAAE